MNRRAHAHLKRFCLFLLPVLFAALLLAACNIVPIAGPSAIATPTSTSAGAPASPASEVTNPQLVGIYQSDVITRAGFGPWTEVMTLTMSLFADGTFEQLFDSAADWGTHLEARGEVAATGSWSDEGDYGLLIVERGGQERFTTLGADALVVSLPTAWFGATTGGWVVTKISPVAEPLYACVARRALSALLDDAARRPDPALAGAYAAPMQFVHETGNAAPTLTLLENGWAEFAVNLEGYPEGYPVEWGVWWATLDAEPTVTLLVKDPQSGMIASAERSYEWDGATLTYRGEQIGSVYSLPLSRTGRQPEIEMAALHEIIFANATGDSTAGGVCRWLQQ